MSYRVRYLKTGIASHLLHDEREDAIKEGEDAGQPFQLERVRQPKLSDFVTWHAVLGDIRERMAELLGDDSQLDSGDLYDAIRGGILQSVMNDAMDAFCEDRGIVLEGAIVTKVEKP